MRVSRRTLASCVLVFLVLALTWRMPAQAAACPSKDAHELPAPFEMRFPTDSGAHPDFGIEWWYVTGWLKDKDQPIGFQITFFRAHPPASSDNPSAFAPRQIIFAHAALSDPRNPRVLFAQRVRRAGFGLAQAQCGTLDVAVARWSMRAIDASGSVSAHIDDTHIGMDLLFKPTQPILLEGDGGVSQKSPAKSARSAYYSLPHLEVTGTIVESGTKKIVQGEAWLDHEWSDRYVDPSAQGWDWLGVNFHDGTSLMAFRMRRADGSPLFAGATRRDAMGAVTVFPTDQVSFASTQTWRSERTRTTYPIGQRVSVGNQQFNLTPLMKDQEIDARDTTGTLYWEGAVHVTDTAATAAGILGEGYLELTGYSGKLQLVISP